MGNIYSNSLYPLQWSRNIELDGHTTILSGKYLNVHSEKVTIDSGVIFSVNGTLEISGNDTITGLNNKWGELAIRSGGTLRVKSGATLNLNAPLYFVIESGANIVVESGGTLNIRTNTSTGDLVNITIPTGAALKIYSPGEIYFGGGSNLIVYGHLNAIGTPSHY